MTEFRIKQRANYAKSSEKAVDKITESYYNIGKILRETMEKRMEDKL